MDTNTSRFNILASRVFKEDAGKILIVGGDFNCSLTKINERCIASGVNATQFFKDFTWYRESRPDGMSLQKYKVASHASKSLTGRWTFWFAHEEDQSASKTPRVALFF